MAGLAFGHRPAGPVDEQVVLGDVRKIYEIRAQGSGGNGVRFGLIVARGHRSLDF